MESSNQPTNQLSPPAEKELDTHHVVIRLAYSAIKALAEYVSTHCEEYLVGEHPPDEEKKGKFKKGIPVIHCHIMIYKMKVTVEALRKEIKKLPGMGRGQYAIMERTERQRELYDKDKLCIYILKGVRAYRQECTFAFITPDPETNMSQEDVWIDAWVKDTGYTEAPTEAEIKEKIKAKRDITIYDICESVWAKGNGTIVLNHQGQTIKTMYPTRENFQIMVNELNKARIRTSRNELERAWVTILRQDEENTRNLFDSINSSINRKFI